jgi:hypothetical protein
MNDYIKKLSAPPAWLLLLAVIFTGDLLFGGRIFLARDWLQDFLPMRLFETKWLLSGEFPFWNQYLGGGKPFIADPQSQALYPVNVLFLLFKPATALNLYWLFHLYISGLGVHFFCRQFDVIKEAAGLAAVTFMLGTWLVSMLEFSINGATGAWIPWIFGVVARFHAKLPDEGCRPLAECWKQRRLVGALAILFAVQFFANFPEFVVYPLAGYVLYIAAVAMAGKNPRGAAAMILFIGIGGLLGLLITLPETVSTRELLPYTERAGAFDARFNMASMSLAHLLSAIFPFIGGFPGFPDKHWESGLFEFWIGAFYSGAIPLMLIPFACWGWSQKSNREKIPVFAALAMILAGIILALGENTPIYPWLHAHAPLLGHFRFPAKFLILAVLGLLILTALGADTLSRKRQAPLPLLIIQGVIVVASGMLALCLWANPNLFISLTAGTPVRISTEALEKAGRFALITWGFLALAYAWVMVVAKSRIKTSPLFVGGILLAFVNLWVVSRQLHPAAPAATALPAAGAATARMAGDTNYRAFSVYSGVQQYLYADPRPEIYGWALQAGSGGMWAGSGIRQQYSAMIKLQKYHQLTSMIYSGNAGLSNQALDLFGVKWIVTGAPWQDILWNNASRDLKIYERRTALPRFKLFNAQTHVASEDEAWERIIQGKLALDAPMIEPTCLFNNDITTRTPSISAAAPSADDKLAIDREMPNNIILRTESGGDRLLVFGDTWYPGWSAAIDGREVPIHRVNYMFMGVEVPAGGHSVEFKFYPRHFTLCSIVALSVLGFSLALTVPGKTSRRLNGTGDHSSSQNHVIN